MLIQEHSFPFLPSPASGLPAHTVCERKTRDFTIEKAVCESGEGAKRFVVGTESEREEVAEERKKELNTNVMAQQFSAPVLVRCLLLPHDGFGGEELWKIFTLGSLLWINVVFVSAFA